MFENSNATEQPKQSLRLGLVSSSPAAQKSGSGSSSSQHLKNLGKAVGAKVNDLLRRKDPSSLGDIGVTEVNKNVEAVWASLAEMGHGTTANSHISLDPFPRLDPPPPTSKKRLPRALKTTQDMMISSDPVVASPEVSDSSLLSSPDKNRLLSTGKAQDQLQPCPEESGLDLEKPSGPSALLKPQIEDEVMGSEVKGQSTDTDAVQMADELKEQDAANEDPSQLLRSVPDLIHKDNLELKQKLTSLETRMASTPCPGKGGCRISLSEEELLENGSVDYKSCMRSSSMETEEPHPDLLSFE
ncbi:uncharacterized protein C1orf226 [Colossoma macropomum]|uniref:uncharacterized protein C1orf226 n=1 Tax=Colossoma macropomum TaxID=42526 RepID=UPI00186458D3|nr:uncharacterized protein C1orf226 [Colossoma macropomum]